ncbi:DUF1524 domain-containing protein [Geodermatophilus sp. YIM 151500]|uniref:GmrSD restriction endonuclease domain-containing protein n=1 Tax=Geodermatophilus sp. YIM 151500 TaxID=2984531 RepID=UPI0021E509D5|nr:DUF1524 domain-containing protein [Geodermatophilus sp. YIM 151500]MCV2491616.1 DUF1524 domain-containing protein [Geodermatophilus sp. YIM 151500]
MAARGDRCRRRPVAAAGSAVALLLAVAGLTACTPVLEPSSGTSTGAPQSSSAAPEPPGTAGGPGPADPGEPGTALASLAELEVKGRAPRTGYDRDLFGDGWGDPDRNGCDARNDVLARDLTDETFKPGTRDCVVATGTLVDPYSGETIAFRRGQDTSDDVQIDHVVAVSDAWQKGAQAWDAARRVAFYNDPLNLLAVDGRLNQQKGDGDAATWLPPDRGYRCAYVARQIAVKLGYDLWVTRAEHDAMATVLGRCPDQPLPDGDGAAPPEPAAAPAAAPTPAPGPASVPEPAAAPVPAPPGGASYRNCDAVRAAGAAPIRVGDPGWRASFDRDGDGVGCE